MSLPQLRRLLLLGSGLSIAIYLVLAFVASGAGNKVQLILPFWVYDVPVAGFILFTLSQLAAVATRRGWRRLIPLLSLGLAFPLFVVVIGFVQIATARWEIDRVSLPNGRVVMMTLEPGRTDAIYGL